jgi:hypothetical protein
MMRRKRIYQWLLFLLPALLLACDRVTDITLPPHVPKLVLHGYVQTGTYFDVVVGRTFPADVVLQESQTYVPDATVTLYEDGVQRDVLFYHAQTKHYRSSQVIAVPGKTYRIVVSAPGFENIEATSYATFPVPATNLRFIKRARASVDGFLLDDISFTFTDPSNAQNYYHAVVKAPQNNSFCIFTYDPVVDKYQAGVNPFESNSCIDQDKILFTDRQFNGQAKEITVSGNSSILEPYRHPTTGDTIRPYLQRNNISRELYDYIRQGVNLDLNGTDPFATPVHIKGNVTGGYGLFAVFSATVDTLRP